MKLGHVARGGWKALTGLAIGIVFVAVVTLTTGAGAAEAIYLIAGTVILTIVWLRLERRRPARRSMSEVRAPSGTRVGAVVSLAFLALIVLAVLLILLNPPGHR